MLDQNRLMIGDSILKFSIENRLIKLIEIDREGDAGLLMPLAMGAVADAVEGDW